MSVILPFDKQLQCVLKNLNGCGLLSCFFRGFRVNRDEVCVVCSFECATNKITK